jgi:hypothetical protein
MPMKCFEFKILYSSCHERKESSQQVACPDGFKGASYLSCGVHDLGCIVLAVVLDNPAEGILDCGVVALHEMLFDKADRERRLA